MQWQGMLLYSLTPHLEDVFPPLNCATLTEPQYGLEGIDVDFIQRFVPLEKVTAIREPRVLGGSFDLLAVHTQFQSVEPFPSTIEVTDILLP